MSDQPPESGPDGRSRDWLDLGGAPRPSAEAKAAEPRAATAEARFSGVRRAAAGFGARLGPAARDGVRRARATAGRFADHPATRRAAAATAAAWRPAMALARRVPWLRLTAATAALVAGLVLAYTVYALVTLPVNGGLTVEPTASALVVRAADGQAFATRGVIKGAKLAPKEVPPVLAKAIVSIEDRRFYEHHGIDLRGLFRAALRNAAAGGTREGGSTLTQQLVRMSYLSQDRTLKRKVQEAVLSLWLESQLPKDEILTRYLNAAYFGAGVYGADAAAQRYFGKPAKDLSLSEAAMLAGLVRAPSQLAPHRNLDGARGRAAQVLDAMVETGAVTKAEADAAKRAPATVRVPTETPVGTNYFVDSVADSVRTLIGTGPADATVRTTLDLTLQNIAESVIARRLDQDGERRKVSQGALVAMSTDGAILAMVGGRDYADSQFNRVTQAKRQPGSLFKLFVYLTALREGYRPDSTLVDRPTQVGEWEPENYGGRYRGAVTLRSAFAHSINTVAVQLAEAVGMPAVIETARGLGVTSDLPNLPSLALGSAETTLLEMTRAYAAVAAGAETIEPYSVRQILARDQALYTRPQAAPTPARDQAARTAMLDLLSAVVREGTGKNARVSVPAGGKTGTTQDSRDAWFVGFAGDLVVGVWLGNDDNTPMAGVTGGDMPAQIWHDFVTQALAARAKASKSETARPEAARQVPGTTPGPRPETASIAEPEADSRARDLAGRAVLRGNPAVVDTGTLDFDGRTVRLIGVDGLSGRNARELGRYLRRRDVACAPAGEGGVYRCSLDGQDLSELILFNGGGRASADATPDLLAAEEQARSNRIGIWRR
ncbi:PBP1A family penicillin-binding protein [Methylobacterium currus]|uniref:PBP1A family penicillin-binding protein n=1 Tax=Methylobacterium currus TaxID=2051553 RepID=A0A2R4WQ53_9HYPH|nr:PBP1A family penicillin-binding protein [Methylobacterium currus]AWB23679.1 PBP1A family penicillin-binding protein [Methylobacterium currus]UHC16650.1 PBP1A family penicillin-binding protein [Methylobacterium currus]